MASGWKFFGRDLGETRAFFVQKPTQWCALSYKMECKTWRVWGWKCAREMTEEG